MLLPKLSRSKYVLAAWLLLPQMAQAEPPSYFVFSLSKTTDTVIATNLVGGYSEDEVIEFIKEHCTGEVAPLMRLGGPRKRRGSPRQRYRTSCTGGPDPSILDVERLAIEVEKMPDGKTLYEYTYSGTDGLISERKIR